MNEFAAMAWAEWKAASLNRLVQKQGTTGEPGHITAATVRHGERNARGSLRPAIMRRIDEEETKRGGQ
jgi:hypothetical protein